MAGILIILLLIFAVVALIVGVRSLGNPCIAGKESLIGQIGEAKTDLAPSGKVFADGTLWNAISINGNITSGSEVQITSIKGLKLVVKQV